MFFGRLNFIICMKVIIWCNIKTPMFLSAHMKKMIKTFKFRAKIKYNGNNMKRIDVANPFVLCASIYLPRINKGQLQ